MLSKEQLITRFPLLATIITKDNLEQIQNAHKNFLYEVVFYEKDKLALTQAISAEVKKIPPQALTALKADIHFLAQKYFKRIPEKLEELIPDLLLLLLSEHPDTPKVVLDAAGCMRMMCAFCEARRVSKEYLENKATTEKHSLRNKAFLIENQAPGLLSKIPDLNEQKLEQISEHISMLKERKPPLTVDAIEQGVLEALGLLENNRPTAKHSAYHPNSQFLEQNANFTLAFPAIAKLEWSLATLKNIYTIASRIYLPNILKQRASIIKSKFNFSNDEKNYLKKLLKTNQAAEELLLDAALIIIFQHELKKIFLTKEKTEELAQQCKLIIEIATFIDKYEKNIHIESPHDARKKKCYLHYFTKLLQKPELMKSAPQFESIDKFEIYLEIDTEEAEKSKTITTLTLAEDKYRLQELFPKVKDNDIEQAIKIKKCLFEPIFYNKDIINLREPFIKKLSPELKEFIQNQLHEGENLTESVFDAVMKIVLENNLHEYTQKSKDEKDILTQCLKIIQTAYQVNNAAKHDKHKPIMMQIGMMMPEAYQFLKKKNTENLKAALLALKNRGAKDDGQIKQEIVFIGNNNEKKKFLYANGITDVPNNRVDLLHNIYQLNSAVINTYLQSKTANRLPAAQITRTILSAFANAKGNSQLFELYLFHPEDGEYLRAMDNTNRIKTDREKLPFQEGGFYCQALLIRHYLPMGTVLNKIDFKNKGSDSSVFQLAQCLTHLYTHEQREAVALYFNQYGNTIDYEYLYTALEVIERDQSQLDAAQRIQLINFLIAKMQAGELRLNSDEFDITDLCIYYNKHNTQSIVGSELVSKREKEVEALYADIEKKIRALFSNKPDCLNILDNYMNNFVFIYAYYLYTDESIKFLETYIKDNVHTASDLDAFNTQLTKTHQSILLAKDPKRLALEFNAPGTSHYAHIITKLDKNTFNYYQRISYAQQFADYIGHNHDEMFLFAFNHPDIAYQCIANNSLIEVQNLDSNDHDLMQLKLFLIQVENNDEDYDFSELIDKLTGRNTSTTLLSKAPQASSSSSSSRSSRIDEKVLKRYVTGFYLIQNSTIDDANKKLMQQHLASNLESTTVAITDEDVTDIKKLSKKLNVDINFLIDLNDDWSLISDDEAKIFSGYFNQKITNKLDLVYAFYYFSNYPAINARQLNIFNTLRNFLQSKDRAVYLNMIIDLKLVGNDGPYAKELIKVNHADKLRAEINRRVSDKVMQANLLAFFQQYPVITKAIAIATNIDWSTMYIEINAYIKNRKVSTQDVEILIEIALLYPGLLPKLPKNANLQNYKKLTRDFGTVKDDAVKRQVIIELCNNPEYKKHLLEKIGLDKKISAKPHHKDESKMKDELLAIHLEYGNVLSAYYFRFKAKDISYVSAYEQIINVKNDTDKYLLNNIGENKKEAFIIHLHWLSVRLVRNDTPSDEFIEQHKQFSKITLNLPEKDNIIIRGKIVELEMAQPGLMAKFASDVRINQEQAIQSYSHLYELHRRKIYLVVRDDNFANHHLFIIYKTISENNFLSENEKNNLINVFVINGNTYEPGFIESIKLLNVYPLLLRAEKRSLIKKYSRELNAYTGLNNHKKLSHLNITYKELSPIAKDNTLPGLKMILREKEKHTRESIQDVANAKEETDNFIKQIFDDGHSFPSLNKRLYEIELATPGILSDIYNEYGKDIDDILNINNHELKDKLPWLINYISKIEYILDLTTHQYNSDIRKLVPALYSDDFLVTAEDYISFNDLSKKQKQEVAPLIPGVLVACTHHANAIRSYIKSNPNSFRENPNVFYNQVIEVSQQIMRLKRKEFDHFILTNIFRNPCLLSTIDNSNYYSNIYYILYQAGSNVISPSETTTPSILFCVQFFQQKNDIDKFISSYNNCNSRQLRNLDRLAHYLSVIWRSNLSNNEKHDFCVNLVKNHDQINSITEFDDSLPYLAKLAGYQYESVVTTPKTENLIKLLTDKIKFISKNRANYKNLSFEAVCEFDNDAITNPLEMNATANHFIKVYETNTAGAKHNDVIINAGCAYYPKGYTFGTINQGIIHLPLKISENQGNTFDSISQVDLSGPSRAQMQIIALLTVYDDFIQKALLLEKPGINFMHLGSVEASYSIKGLSKDYSTYYDMTSWKQDNIAAANYALVAHDSDNIPNIFEGREKDYTLKFNAASQLFADGLMLYSTFDPIIKYSLTNDKLIFNINFSDKENGHELKQILSRLLFFNDLKQFNHGICSQKNLKLIAELFGLSYSVTRDNIATLLYRYQKNVIKSPFADQVYAQFGFYLRGIIDESQFLTTICQCDGLPANNKEAQTKLLRHLKALKPAATNTAAPVTAAAQKSLNPTVPVTQPFSSYLNDLTF